GRCRRPRRHRQRGLRRDRRATALGALHAGQGARRHPGGAKNVALFGGTFDPIHRGHLAVARAARRQLMLEEILFVPSGVPPHKRADAVTPFHDRHAMVVLATAGERPFVPSRLEDPDLVAGAPYSIDPGRRLRRALGPSDRPLFLRGVGAFLDIAPWRDAEVLTRGGEFVVASRPGLSLAALPRRVGDR